MSTHIQPGLIALHGNRAETLASTVFAWLRQHPLAPLEEEVVLVQSNGMAEWFKMLQARDDGICAAARVELPSRFLWRTYRQVLGWAQVPALSPVDKTPLTWRLMYLLPDLLEVPAFQPVARFLRPGEPDRWLQLASRLADLFDQYQVYRPDWLTDWSEGRDVLAAPGRKALAVPPDQLWQPLLWRAVLKTLDEHGRSAIRPHIHQRAMRVLQQGEALAAPVARRVVLFGMTHVPLPVLQLLAALSAHSQVLLAIPNPCQFHWADTIDGRELLRMERRRHPLREGRNLAALPLEQMHAHAHPLLAAWGRQGRDFVRQLDEFDDAQQAQERFALPRVDLFDEDEDSASTPLLTQMQHRIRDLVPLAEHPTCAVAPIAPADRSVVFHVAHSALREVEILHDQLLRLLEQSAESTKSTADKPALQPRDVVVMVPDIDTLAPAIRAVFGQYGRFDKRFIPFDITDLSARAKTPLITALDWLLRLPQQRCQLSELCDLLEIPAVAARFGVAEDALPRLRQWMSGAGIRWGLNEAQRADLGLDACGAQNTATFGLQRMLLGYASGKTRFADQEPYPEVGGLEAELAGALASLLHQLECWRAEVKTPATPLDWAVRLRALLAATLKPVNETDQEMLAALDDALIRWQDACTQAGFDTPIPLSVARKAWMDTLQEPSLNARFQAGGVTFCTLMPMRAVPFQVVCLLGMNDGDYPRRVPRSDFDLMALPGQNRPGDRSRQSDDRQLMLEALLSARRVLYISWSGRSVRDHSEQPPSVLVSQLRDYVAAGWGDEVLAQRTIEHPLQPFSRRYFEGHPELWTYAREWRAAHVVAPDETVVTTATTVPTTITALTVDVQVPLTVAKLAAFLRHPVKTFFRERLGVVWENWEQELVDEESFGLAGLQEYVVVNAVAKAVLLALVQGPEQATAPDASPEAVAALVATHLERLRAAGELPLGGFAERAQNQLNEVLLPLLQAWQGVQAQYPNAVERVSLRHVTPPTAAAAAVVLEDWLDGLRQGPEVDSESESAPGAETIPVWLDWTPSRLTEGAKKPEARIDKLLLPWVLNLAAAASGVPVQGVLVGRDAILHLPPLRSDDARATLEGLLQLWHDGMQSPLPLALKTAVAQVQGKDAAASYDGDSWTEGEGAEPCLARFYPDFEALNDGEQFVPLAGQLVTSLLAWAQTVSIKSVGTVA